MDSKINIGSPLEIDEKIKVVEAVIFIEADPQPTRQIAKLTGIAIKEVSSILTTPKEIGFKCLNVKSGRSLSGMDVHAPKTKTTAETITKINLE